MPVAGPVPPPIMVVMPDISDSSICCGQMKWMWVSMPPAVTIRPSAERISVSSVMYVFFTHSARAAWVPRRLMSALTVAMKAFASAAVGFVGAFVVVVV